VVLGPEEDELGRLLVADVEVIQPADGQEALDAEGGQDGEAEQGGGAGQEVALAPRGEAAD
jgi:hypothetical protein